MGKGKSLTEDERQVIIYGMDQGHTAGKIGKLLKRDPKTIKKAINDINFARKTRTDKGKCKMLSEESVALVKEVARKHPGMSSKEIFDIAGVAGISKTLRCRVLRKAGYIKNTFRRPSISVENISTESLRNIKAIMQTNPHLSSKDIFELAGVPDVGKTLRDQILEEFAASVRHATNHIGTVGDIINGESVDRVIAGNTEEVACMTNSDITTSGFRPSEATSADVATENREPEVIVIKEERFMDNINLHRTLIPNNS